MRPWSFKKESILVAVGIRWQLHSLRSCVRWCSRKCGDGSADGFLNAEREDVLRPVGGACDRTGGALLVPDDVGTRVWRVVRADSPPKRPAVFAGHA